MASLPLAVVSGENLTLEASKEGGERFLLGKARCVWWAVEREDTSTWYVHSDFSSGFASQP